MEALLTGAGGWAPNRVIAPMRKKPTSRTTATTATSMATPETVYVDSVGTLWSHTNGQWTRHPLMVPQTRTYDLHQLTQHRMPILAYPTADRRHVELATHAGEFVSTGLYRPMSVFSSHPLHPGTDILLSLDVFCVTVRYQRSSTKVELYRHQDPQTEEVHYYARLQQCDVPRQFPHVYATAIPVSIGKQFDGAWEEPSYQATVMTDLATKWIAETTLTIDDLERRSAGGFARMSVSRLHFPAAGWALQVLWDGQTAQTIR